MGNQQAILEKRKEETISVLSYHLVIGPMREDEFLFFYKVCFGQAFSLEGTGMNSIREFMREMGEVVDISTCEGREVYRLKSQKATLSSSTSATSTKIASSSSTMTRSGELDMEEGGACSRVEGEISGQKNGNGTFIKSIEELRRNVVAVLKACKQPVDDGDFISTFERMTGCALTQDVVWTKYGYSKLIDLMRAELNDIVEISDVKSYTFNLSLKSSSMQITTSPSSTTTTSTTAALTKKADEIEELRRNVTAALKGCSAPLEVNQFIKRYFDLTGIKLTNDVVQKKYGYTQLLVLMESELSDIVDVVRAGTTVSYRLKTSTPIAAPKIETKAAATTPSPSTTTVGSRKDLEDLRRNVIAVLQTCNNPIEGSRFVAMYEKMAGVQLTNAMIKSKFGFSKLNSLMQSLSDIVEIRPTPSGTFFALRQTTTTTTSTRLQEQATTVPSTNATADKSKAALLEVPPSASAPGTGGGGGASSGVVTKCVGSTSSASNQSNLSIVESMRDKIRTVIVNNNGAVEVSEFIPRYKETTGEELRLSAFGVSTLIELVEKMFEGCSGDDAVKVKWAGSKMLFALEGHLVNEVPSSMTAAKQAGSHAPTVTNPSVISNSNCMVSITSNEIEKLRRNVVAVLKGIKSSVDSGAFVAAYMKATGVQLSKSTVKAKYGFDRLDLLMEAELSDIVETRRSGSAISYSLKESELSVGSTTTIAAPRATSAAVLQVPFPEAHRISGNMIAPASNLVRTSATATTTTTAADKKDILKPAMANIAIEELRRNIITVLRICSQPVEGSVFKEAYEKMTGRSLHRSILKMEYGFPHVYALIKSQLSDVVDVYFTNTGASYQLKLANSSYSAISLQTPTVSSVSTSSSNTSQTKNAVATSLSALLATGSEERDKMNAGNGGNDRIEEFRRSVIAVLRTFIVPVEVGQFMISYERMTGCALTKDVVQKKYGYSKLIDLITAELSDIVEISDVKSYTFNLSLKSSSMQITTSPSSTTSTTAALTKKADEIEELRRNVTTTLKGYTAPLQESRFITKYFDLTGIKLTNDVVKQKYGYTQLLVLMESELSDIVDVVRIAGTLSYRLKTSTPMAALKIETKAAAVAPSPSTTGGSKKDLEDLRRNVVAVLKDVENNVDGGVFVAAYMKATGVQLSKSTVKVRYGFDRLDLLMESELSDIVETKRSGSAISYSLKEPKPLTTTSATAAASLSSSSNSAESMRNKIRTVIINNNGAVEVSEFIPRYKETTGEELRLSAFGVSTLIELVEKMFEGCSGDDAVIVDRSGSKTMLVMNKRQCAPSSEARGGGAGYAASYHEPSRVHDVEEIIAALRNNFVILLRYLDEPIEKMQFVAMYKSATGMELTDNLIRATFGYSGLDELMKSRMSDIIETSKVGTTTWYSSKDSSIPIAREMWPWMRDKIRTVIINNNGAVEVSEFIPRYKETTGEELQLSAFGVSTLIELVEKMFEGCSGDDAVIVDRSGSKTMLVMKKRQPAPSSQVRGGGAGYAASYHEPSRVHDVEEIIAALRNNFVILLRYLDEPIEKMQFVAMYKSATGMELTDNLIRATFGYSGLDELMKSRMSDIIEIERSGSTTSYCLKASKLSCGTATTPNIEAPRETSAGTVPNISGDTITLASHPAAAAAAAVAGAEIRISKPVATNSSIEDLRRNVVAVLKGIKSSVDSGAFVAAYMKATGVQLSKSTVKAKYGFDRLDLLMESELSDIVETKRSGSAISYSLKESKPLTTTSATAAASLSSSSNSAESMRNKIRTVIINNNGAVEVSEFIPRYKETTGEELRLSAFGVSTLIELVEKMFEGCSGDDAVIVDRSGSKTMLVMKKQPPSQPSTLPPPPPPITPPPALTKPHRQLRRNIRHILNLASGKLEIRMLLMMYRHTFDVVLDPSKYGFGKLGDMFRWMGDMVEVKKEGSHVFLYLAPTEEDDEEEEETWGSEYGEEPTQSAMEELCSNVRSILAQEATREIEASELLDKYFLLFGKKLCPEEYGFSRWSEFVGCMGEMVCVKQRRNVNNNNSKEEGGEWYLVFQFVC